MIDNTQFESTQYQLQQTTNTINSNSYDLEWMLPFFREHCNKNRTLVSDYNEIFLADLSKRLPFKIHRYRTGEDHSTWLIPPKWDVIEAYLADIKGNIIASYNDHPLFLAAYSKSYDGEISKEELLKRVMTREGRPDDFLYQHRLALNFQLRLTDFGLSLPHNIYKNLTDEKYYLKINTKVENGEMLVGEFGLKGKRKHVFSFLAHMCHPGQVNDGIAGVAIGLAVMEILKQRTDLQFSYEFLVMPETFGSAVYISSHEEKIEDYFGCLFIEMPGAGSVLTFNHSRNGKLYFDLLLKHVVESNYQETSEYKFHRGMGNDELNFDWPAVGVPGLAMYWSRFKEYHTSGDSPDRIEMEKLTIYLKTLMSFIDILERDYIPRFTQRVQIYQTRFNLYIDAFNQPELYHKVTDLLFMIDGEKTLFEVTRDLSISFDEAYNYLEQYFKLGFLEKKEIPIEKYKRSLI